MGRYAGGMNPPTEPANSPSKKQDDLGSYHKIADTIGGVPSLRVKDYVIQGSAAGEGLVVGAVAGLLLAPANKWDVGTSVSLGGFGGLVAGVFVAGLVLMVMGWTRHKK